MQILRFLRSTFTLPLTFLSWMEHTVVKPETDGEPVPPIRYDDDPTDIYLA